MEKNKPFWNQTKLCIKQDIKDTIRYHIVAFNSRQNISNSNFFFYMRECQTVWFNFLSMCTRKKNMVEEAQCYVFSQTLLFFCVLVKKCLSEGRRVNLLKYSHSHVLWRKNTLFPFGIIIYHLFTCMYRYYAVFCTKMIFTFNFPYLKIWKFCGNLRIKYPQKLTLCYSAAIQIWMQIKFK